MGKETRDAGWYSNLFKEEMKDKFSNMDETTLDYAISIVKDETTDEEDTIASLAPLLEGIVEDEPLSNTIAKNIFRRIRAKPDAPAKAAAPAKVLGAPVMIARVIEQQSSSLKEILKTEMPVTVNFNTTMSRTIEDVMGVNAELSDKENKAIASASKNVVKRDRKGQMREQRLALEREEVLHRLQTKLVKLHESAKDASRIRDIKLEDVNMSLTNLELLRDINITFVHGHKYLRILQS
eukprot:TRINITY_DN4345_c0_g2_i2.p1 TRINITY_DN4345_c0_g2~~TRINITY_DN4345_c0_g2_i2.p1  ORF type:complete len:238 (+),score=74.70 TRINITY_DN4345_c0_g2_i2:114-827(+)